MNLFLNFNVELLMINIKHTHSYQIIFREEGCTDDRVFRVCECGDYEEIS